MCISQACGVHLTGVHLIGVYLMALHLTSVHLTGMHLMEVHLMGVLTDVHLTGVHLINVHLMGVRLIDGYLMGVTSLTAILHERQVYTHRQQPVFLDMFHHHQCWMVIEFCITIIAMNRAFC